MLATLTSSVALAAALVVLPIKIVMLLAAAALATAAALLMSPMTLAVLLIAATFVTRFSLTLGPVTLRAEQVAMFILLAAVILQGRRVRSLEYVVTRPAVLLLAAFIAYSVVASALFAQSFDSSLRIIAWIAMSFVLMVVVTATVETRQELERIGVAAAGVAATAALILYGLAQAGVVSFGTAYEHVTGTVALYGLSLEANLLGSTMAIWCYLALTSSAARTSKLYQFTIVVGTVALLLTLTRAAILGLALGLLIALPGLSPKVRRAIRRPLAGLAAVAVLAIVAIPGTVLPALAKYSPSSIVNVESTTGSYRVNAVEVARSDVTNYSALFGLGTNSYGQRHREPTSEGFRPAYLPSFPVQVIYDTGLVGAILLIAALIAFHPIQALGAPRALGLGAVFLLTSLTTSQFWFGTTWLLLAMFLVDRSPRARPSSVTRARLTPDAS